MFVYNIKMFFKMILKIMVKQKLINLFGVLNHESDSLKFNYTHFREFLIKKSTVNVHARRKTFLNG